MRACAWVLCSDARTDEAAEFRANGRDRCTYSRWNFYSGSSGSRLALRRADVADADVVERTKLQRMLEACRES
jgi:hypothetical protein